MDSEWEKLVKRYVWNDERTPYFTRVANLSRRQAHYELFGYALLVGVFGGVLAFGFIGIFIGPPLLAVGLILVRLWIALPSAQTGEPGAGPPP